MTPADARRFGDLWQVAAERTGSRARSDAALQMDFEDLARFDFAEIMAAARAHCSKPGEQWMPKVGDIVQLIEGALPSTDALVALAHAARTPLGKMLSVKLGTDMTRLHAIALAPRMGTYRDYATDLHKRALIGEYTDIEIRTIVGAGIDPAGPLGPETAGPRAPFRAGVEARAAAARDTLQVGSDSGKTTRKAGLSDRDMATGRENLAQLGALFGTLNVKAAPSPMTDEQRMKSRARLREYRERGEKLFADRKPADRKASA